MSAQGDGGGEGTGTGATWPGFPPSLVGERVVVRRELAPGRSYGDVLGVLLAVDADSLCIATRHGEVTVALDTVVAARQVRPPRSGR